MKEDVAGNTLSKLFEFAINSAFGITIYVSGWFIGALVVVSLLVVLFAWARSRRFLESFEIDGAELGIGEHKIKLSPNQTDREIAYKIWVELSTRKIGLPIDLEHDVIEEVYDSWYAFFGITRELIKTVPIQKLHREGTARLVNLSIDVLNEGLRPHLTKWQARFRRWYSQQTREGGEFAHLTPQEIQRRFPDFQALSTDLRIVNDRLIAYRKKMRILAFQDGWRGLARNSSGS